MLRCKTSLPDDATRPIARNNQTTVRLAAEPPGALSTGARELKMLPTGGATNVGARSIHLSGFRATVVVPDAQSTGATGWWISTSRAAKAPAARSVPVSVCQVVDPPTVWHTKTPGKRMCTADDATMPGASSNHILAYLAKEPLDALDTRTETWKILSIGDAECLGAKGSPVSVHQGTNPVDAQRMQMRTWKTP